MNKSSGRQAGPPPIGRHPDRDLMDPLKNQRIKRND